MLLGPQRRPTVDSVVRNLDPAGPIATVTAGWQEREPDDAELDGLLAGRSVNLRLYDRWLDVLARDPEYAAAELEHRAALDELQQLYLVQLDGVLRARAEVARHAGRAGVRTLALADADAAVRLVDERHLARVRDERGDVRRGLDAGRARGRRRAPGRRPAGARGGGRAGGRRRARRRAGARAAPVRRHGQGSRRGHRLVGGCDGARPSGSCCSTTARRTGRRTRSSSTPGSGWSAAACCCRTRVAGCGPTIRRGWRCWRSGSRRALRRARRRRPGRPRPGRRPPAGHAGDRRRRHVVDLPVADPSTP